MSTDLVHGTVNFPTSPGLAGPLAEQLLDQAAADVPALTTRTPREQLLLSAWLVTLRSVRTMRAYYRDVTGWLDWLGELGVDPLAARRTHTELWVRRMQTGPPSAAAATINRRLAALTGWYGYLAEHDLVVGVPTVGVARPEVDPDHTDTVGLDREQARALTAAADADTGPARLRSAAIVRLLLHNALRIDELLTADVAGLGADRGHRVLRIVGKGNRPARIALAPGTWAALQTYLADRAAAADLPGWEQLTGPLVATATGRRMQPSQVDELVQRLARTAGIASWRRITPHSLRHTAITLALDAGVPLRDAQDYARHRDPRTTRRYDRNRTNLDRSPAYTVAAYLA